MARTASVTLVHHVDGPGSTIRADAEAVDRLISVLLDNACRYAGSGGRVEMGVTRVNGQVTLLVEDSGPGIPEAERELVLDRFHRADERPGGTGLGLAIADAVVRITGGTWSIGRSELGGARHGSHLESRGGSSAGARARASADLRLHGWSRARF